MILTGLPSSRTVLRDHVCGICYSSHWMPIQSSSTAEGLSPRCKSDTSSKNSLWQSLTKRGLLAPATMTVYGSWPARGSTSLSGHGLSWAPSLHQHLGLNKAGPLGVCLGDFEVKPHLFFFFLQRIGIRLTESRH